MWLQRVFAEIQGSDCNFCVLCFRTERSRKLKLSKSLNDLVGLLDPEYVWLWKNNKKMEHYVCYFCDSKVSSALRTVNMVCIAVRRVKLLNSYKKSNNIGKHLIHVSAHCERDLKYVQEHTRLCLSVGVDDKIMSTKDGYTTTYSFNCSRTRAKRLPIASTSNTRSITINRLAQSMEPSTQITDTVPMTPQINPATLRTYSVRRNPNASPMNKTTPGIDPITSSINTIAPSMNTITPPMNTITPPMNTITPPMNTITPLLVNTSMNSIAVNTILPMNNIILGINKITPGIDPITSSINTVATSMNAVMPQMYTFTPLTVNPTTPEPYTFTPLMNTIAVNTISTGINTITSEINPITPLIILNDAIMETDAIAEETEPDCYIKSETESVASGNQLDNDFEKALDSLRDDLDDYILPDVDKHSHKREIPNNQATDQSNHEPALIRNTIKLVPQDKLLQPQMNTIKPETNPIQSDINTINQTQSGNQPGNTGRILACTLNNGDMAFCPIVTYAGKNFVPALKCVLENGVLSPVENIDWDKIALLTNDTEVTDMMSGLAQTNMQGILSSIGANPAPLPNNLSLNDVQPLTNMSSGALNEMDTNQGTPRLQENMASISSGGKTVRLKVRMDPSGSQGNLLQENGKSQSIYGHRNVARPMVTGSSGHTAVRQSRVRFRKGLVVFDNKMPQLLLPKLTDAEIERHGNRTKYSRNVNATKKTIANELNKLRKEMRFVANPNSAFRNPSVANLDYPMPGLGYSVASDQNEITPVSVASNNTSKTPAFEENFRLFATAQNMVQPKRSDVSIDWEDKIPMDVITYVNATDPNAAEYLTPGRPKPPPPPAPPAEPAAPTVKDSAFGFISNCVGADDVICLD